MEKIRVSIVTPTYNRANYIKGCYESLLKQSVFDFEWIIVDDGSVDETESVISEFVTDKFQITYLKKQNGGKHTALNYAHSCIHGEFVLILDSDDILTPDAIETVLGGWARYRNNSSIGIVTFLKGDMQTKQMLCYAADEFVPVDIMTYKRTIVSSSDCCEVIRADLFMKYPFPVFEGERFLAEGALWSQVSFTHKCVYINKVIYLCDYLEQGLSKSGRKMFNKNPHGGMHNAAFSMNKKNRSMIRIKGGLLYVSYGFFAGMSIQEMLNQTEEKNIVALCMPFGWLLFRYWKYKYKD